jgi:hypothetical protein
VRLFDTFSESEKQIVRYQCKQLVALERSYKAFVTIPNIPTDEDEEIEFIGEAMPRQSDLLVPLAPKSRANEYKKERKQKKRGAVRVGPRVRHQAQSPVTIGAADIVAKKRPELRGNNA